MLTTIEHINKPSFFSFLSHSGRIQIKEYESLMAYQNAVNDLNKKLESKAAKMRAMHIGDETMLHVNQFEHYYTKHPGSFRVNITVKAYRDLDGNIVIIGDRKYDSLRDDLSIVNEKTQIRVDTHGQILEILSGRFSKIIKFHDNIWLNPAYEAKMLPVNNRIEKTHALEHLIELLS